MKSSPASVARCSLSVPSIRCDAGHHHHREGSDQRRDTDGRSVRPQADLRGVHAGSAERDRAVSRLHVLGTSGCMRCGAGDAGRSIARWTADARSGAWQRNGKTPCIHCAVCRTSSISAISAWWPESKSSRERCAWRARVRGVSQGYEKGILVRFTGDILALSPPLIIEPAQIDELIGTLAETIGSVA